jgi:uracil-DNA glycosylase
MINIPLQKPITESLPIQEKDCLWDDLNFRIITCRRCPRLVAHRESVARIRKKAYQDWDYWGKPVPGFGDVRARLLLVGLAPGAHGSNRTGRMFTGDSSGIFLYKALFKAGFANQPDATTRDDELQLKDAFISAVCRCAPPGNHPTPTETAACQPYLLEEMRLLNHLCGIVALGQIAYNRLLRIYQIDSRAAPQFSHGGLLAAGDDHPWILTSYHPSRQNTQTGRLTVDMFDAIWCKAAEMLS